jgi:hypothetical protein
LVLLLLLLVVVVQHRFPTLTTITVIAQRIVTQAVLEQHANMLAMRERLVTPEHTVAIYLQVVLLLVAVVVVLKAAVVATLHHTVPAITVAQMAVHLTNQLGNVQLQHLEQLLAIVVQTLTVALHTLQADLTAMGAEPTLTVINTAVVAKLVELFLITII